MERKYRISWYANKDKLQRTSYIKLSKPTGDTSIDAKTALSIFIIEFGDLRHNTIIKIQEFDENDNQIGKDIIPADKNIVVPIV